MIAISQSHKQMSGELTSRRFNHALTRLSREELQDLVSSLGQQLRRFQLQQQQQRRAQVSQHGQPMMPRIDIFDDPDSQTVVAHVEIPGMRKEDVTLQVHDGVLIVAGERKPAIGGEYLPVTALTTQRPASPPSASEDAPQNKFRVQELKYGNFRRAIAVPGGLSANEISASMSDGMLMITWPREPAAARDLAIDVD